MERLNRLELVFAIEMALAKEKLAGLKAATEKAGSMLAAVRKVRLAEAFLAHGRLHRTVPRRGRR